jgi:hypothetical protein
MEPLTQRISAFVCWHKSASLSDAEASGTTSLAGKPRTISGSTRTGLRTKVLFFNQSFFYHIRVTVLRILDRIVTISFGVYLVLWF